MLPLYLRIGRTEDNSGSDRYLRLTLSSGTFPVMLVQGWQQCAHSVILRRIVQAKTVGNIATHLPPLHLATLFVLEVWRWQQDAPSAVVLGLSQESKVGNTDTLVPLHHLSPSVVLGVWRQYRCAPSVFTHNRLVQVKQVGNTPTHVPLFHLSPLRYWKYGA